jgi:hypothetical protein
MVMPSMFESLPASCRALAMRASVVDGDAGSVCPVADAAATRSANETSSAKVRTCNFTITLWRWALMVRSVAPKMRPICLLVLPRMICSKTCCSRGVSPREERE